MRHLILLLLTFCSLAFAGKPSGDPCRHVSDPHVMAYCLQDQADGAAASDPVKEPRGKVHESLVGAAKVLGVVGAGFGAMLLLGVSLLVVTGAQVGGC